MEVRESALSQARTNSRADMFCGDRNNPGRPHLLLQDSREKSSCDATGTREGGQCTRGGAPERGGGTTRPLKQNSAQSSAMDVWAGPETCESSALAVLFSHKTRSQIIS